MTQVWLEEVSLEDVVATSTLVVLVRWAEPRSRAREIPINQPTWDGEPCPPFMLHFGRFEVEQVLRGPDELQGTTIEVAPADWRSDFGSHVNYYVEGIGESPIIPSYTPRGDTSTDRLILFCANGSESLEYTVRGAFEGPDMLDTVRELLTHSVVSGNVVLVPGPE